MTTIKTIIFDFDGTLADCKELHQAAFRSAVEQCCPAAEYTDHEVEGLPTRVKIEYLKNKGYEFDSVLLNKIKQEKTQEHIQEYIVYNAELKNEIERLSKKYKLCLATNATAAFIIKSLDIMQIRSYFTRINTATEYPAKPDPYTFIDCMTCCSSNHRSTVIFEDSEVGLECARKIVLPSNVIAVTDATDTLRKLQDFI